MKKFIHIICFFCFLTINIFAQDALETLEQIPEMEETLSAKKAETEKIVYISPNNDGVQDALIVPIKIQDKRYISEWNFIITDENDNIVRTIGNKISMPETPKSVAKSLFSKDFFKTLKRLFAPKQGVNIPENVMWNGILESGETAPDGLYKYYLTAKDDNGNEAKTVPMLVYVDNTAPDIDLVQLSEGAKIFGAGNKPTVKFEQSGSVEDLWTANIINANGESVKSFEWKNTSPVTIEWDGRSNSGSPVAEGVYTYKIEAIDRAGNKNEITEVTNIIYDAVPRSVNMLVKDSPFSPNGDGVKDFLTIEPSMPNASGLTNWEIVIKNSEDKVMRKFEGSTTAPKTIIYDGKNDAGVQLLDGDYTVVFNALFNNGQEAFIQRNITIDNTAPSASLIVDNPNFVFSPDGDGQLDVLKITQETSKERLWNATIEDEKGKIVKTWSFPELPPTTIEWNGITEDGKLAPDGHYVYKISATDAAGNSFTTATPSFQLDTSKTEIILTVNLKAFSPNGDKIQDNIVFTPVTKSTSGIKSYELNIYNGDGKSVKKVEAKKSLPASFIWDGKKDDGKIAEDGVYYATLKTVSVNGSETLTASSVFDLDTVAPNISVEVPYLVFSPNGDGNKDILPVKLKDSSVEVIWNASFENLNKKAVKSFTWKGKAESFDWNGHDETGNIVADGLYKFIISCTDDAGNKIEKVIDGINIDNRVVKTYVTADLNGISPNADNIKDVQRFSIMTTPKDGVANWKFSIVTEGKKDSSNAVRSWSSKDTKNLPAQITWDGLNDKGKVVEGKFSGLLELEYVKGDKIVVNSTPFVSSITPPRLNVKTAPEYFSPDNDGEADDLFIALKADSDAPFTKWSFDINDPQNGRQFWGTSGKKTITERIIWDGRGKNGELVQSAMDYPFVFSVTDELGMTSTLEGKIPIDVLVIRMGNVLKMQVPSIIFRSDKADFVGKDVDPNNGLPQDKIDNNIRVLKRIAEILNKFQDYKVTIEGHANNISGTEEEETSTIVNGQKNIPLVPLSLERAEFVKQTLIKNGVSASRLSTVGQGGRIPVVKRADRENWWKNRRVEFILEK